MNQYRQMVAATVRERARERKKREKAFGLCHLLSLALSRCSVGSGSGVPSRVLCSGKAQNAKCASEGAPLQPHTVRGVK